MDSKLSLILTILTITSIFSAAAAAGSHSAAPTPAVDCSSLVLNMADCLSFVSNGSTTTKPEGTCCSGLKTVLKTNAECLCEAFKSSAQFGVVLNVTKALSLPTACKLHAPDASKCGLSLAPAGSPGLSPTLSPTGAPSGISGSNVQAPAPAPAGGSSALSISVASLAIGLAVASLSGF